MKVVALFSGGKDSTYATWIAQHEAWDIEVLVSVLPRSVDSMMFHYPNAQWTSIQARAMGIPHRPITAGQDELLSLKDGLEAIAKAVEIDGVVTGAVASDYQKTRIDQVCDTLGLRSFAPLWHKDPGRLVSDLRQVGLEIIVSGVGASGLDASWLGQELNSSRWAILEQMARKHGIHLTGEGGEYETFVVNGPNFNERVRVNRAHRVWDGQSGYLVIDDASLEAKPSN